MSATLPEQEKVFIRLTPTASLHLEAIIMNGKTPIIKIENNIYHPIRILASTSEYINYSNNSYLIILPAK